MEDKGEVKCIKFSLENKILAVQRTSKTVVRRIFKYSIKKDVRSTFGSEWIAEFQY